MPAAPVVPPEDPWSVAAWAFPHAGTVAEQLTFLVHYAVLAPSGHNTQPWRFRIADDAIELRADRSRALPAVDPGDRELVMSCGAALFHLRVAMRHFGFAPDVARFPEAEDPDVLARVRLGARLDRRAAPTLEDDRLFMAIPRRRTNRRPFAPRPVPEGELDVLRDAARREGAHLHVLAQASDKAALADLIAEGDRLQGGNPAFRRELAAWLEPNRSDRPDGIPGYAHGHGDLRAYVGPLIVRTFDWGDGQAARDRQLAEGSPVLLVLGTDRDDPPAHLAAGEALDRVLLTATAYDLSASYLNQPIETPALREAVAGLAGAAYPQVILRLGYGPPVPPTPRRPASDVLDA